MEFKLTSKNDCYVFDASSLIEIEGKKGKGLKSMPDFPGKWLIVPSKVAKEVNSEGAPKETKDWIVKGKPAKFNSDNERQLYMKIRVQESALDDADIEGIVLAYHRKATYVVEEGPAGTIAQKLNVTIINAKQFLDIIRPQLI